MRYKCIYNGHNIYVLYVIQAVRNFFLNKLYQQTNLLYKLTITKNNNIILKKN